MKNTQKRINYLTFPIDALASDLLKKIAHDMGKTQPELLNEICNNYIQNYLLEHIEMEFAEEQHVTK